MTRLFTANRALTLLALLIIIRLVSLGLYPLMDTTEARYGEMARLMVETGNWLTPQFDYGVPFWGKPPLHTWMSASFIALFDASEFFIRLPHWLAALLLLAVIGQFAKKIHLPALPSMLILSAIPVFYICTGAVMTDMALALAFTLAMSSFYLAWQGARRFAYLGFAGLALGLLAKGPLILVLFGLGTGSWLIWQHGIVNIWRLLWQRIPLISGSLLLVLLTLPWYLMAEQATPGFLEYFIIGEHWLRFTQSGWAGDLYGTAHDEPRGMIWVFFLLAALPWSFLLPFALIKLRQANNAKLDGLSAFLLCWLLAPLVLFTFAGNILPAYVLPGTPALALLISKAWQQDVSKWYWLTLISPALLITAIFVVNKDNGAVKSERYLLSQRSQDIPSYYLEKQPFSGRFYSLGLAKKIPNITQWQASTLPRHYLIVEKHLLAQPALAACQRIYQGPVRSLLLCEPNQLNERHD
jgi:4-amino-4-deoxy-L-arabinose transferase-like glycosyltransferase